MKDFDEQYAKSRGEGPYKIYKEAQRLANM